MAFMTVADTIRVLNDESRSKWSFSGRSAGCLGKLTRLAIIVVDDVTCLNRSNLLHFHDYEENFAQSMGIKWNLRNLA